MPNAHEMNSFLSFVSLSMFSYFISLSLFHFLSMVVDLDVIVYFHPFLFSLLGNSYSSFFLRLGHFSFSIRKLVPTSLAQMDISPYLRSLPSAWKARSHLSFPKTYHAVFSNHFLLGLSSKVTVSKFKASTISFSSLNPQHHQQYPQSKQLMKVC